MRSGLEVSERWPSTKQLGTVLVCTPRLLRGLNRCGPGEGDLLSLRGEPCSLGVARGLPAWPRGEPAAESLPATRGVFGPQRGVSTGCESEADSVKRGVG